MIALIKSEPKFGVFLENITAKQMADLRAQVESDLASPDAVAWREANKKGATRALERIYFRLLEEISNLDKAERRFVAAKLRKSKLWVTELNPVHDSLFQKWLGGDQSSASYDKARLMQDIAVELDPRIIASPLEWAMLSGDPNRYARMCASIDLAAMPANSHLYPDSAYIDDMLRGWSMARSITEGEVNSYNPPIGERKYGFGESFSNFSSSLFTLAILLSKENSHPEYDAVVTAKFNERQYLRIAVGALRDLSNPKLFLGMQNAWRAHGYPSKNYDEFVSFVDQRMATLGLD